MSLIRTSAADLRLAILHHLDAAVCAHGPDPVCAPCLADAIVVDLQSAADDAGEVPVAPEQPLLTVAEVADHLRVGKATIYRILERGELEHFAFGGAIRVSAEHLGAYLARSLRGAA